MGELLIGRNTDPADFIRRYAEKNRDWPYAEFVTTWYPRVEEIKRRFFDGVFKPWDMTRLPNPPIAIEDMRNWKYLASYRLVTDGYGFSDKLTINETHLHKNETTGKYEWDYGGEWGLGETISHEVCHEAMVRRGLDRGHGKPFINKLLDLGIHCNERGQHTSLADLDSPFGILMKEWFIRRPDEEIKAGTKGRPINWWTPDGGKKGVSTLSGWWCEACGLKVRVGIKGNPELVHLPCGTLLVRRG